RDRVVATGSQRVATSDPLQRQPGAGQDPEPADGSGGVSRACRLVTTIGPEIGTYQFLVTADEPDQPGARTKQLRHGAGPRRRFAASPRVVGMGRLPPVG